VVEVCLRSEETDYQVDHFRALCRFDAQIDSHPLVQALAPAESTRLELDPAAELYGRVLFQEGRFRRLRGYRWLTAKECVAEIVPEEGVAWFGPYLPAEFVLGNPAARDAALHALQACVPHQRILPIGIERLAIRRTETGPRVVRARERHRQGNNFTYDVEILDAEGEVIERWEALQLRAVEPVTPPTTWPMALLVPYLGRRLEELGGELGFRVALEKSLGRNAPHTVGSNRCPSATRALEEVPGDGVWRRPDGKPIPVSGQGISAAHTQTLTLAVAGPAPIACDLETVQARPKAVWRDLLGDEGSQLTRRISQHQAEAEDLAGTRLWTAMECLKKAGLPPQAPLVLDSGATDGWVLLRSGRLTIATWITTVQELESKVALAVAFDSNSRKR
jgi:enediyne polyketide synthase